ncbi:unnamed protein product [Phytophthora fragariaefolia]|uniref:Unnamed protein product n=1 Tax=Phytophthora fragariaefolia TaxID=1490495 RepID=A0A9W7CZF6_9STRA|nr:unnamed protein product [Phytophthora fragariaefolia]
MTRTHDPNLLSSVIQATSPKKDSFAAAGLLSLDEAMIQVLAGILPATRTGPSGIQDVVPTRQVSPPKMAPSSHCFSVGVPATTRAYRDDKYVQDGYGGVEALMLFEGLSEQDLGDLGTLFAQDGEETRSIHDLILRPHSAGPPPLVTLEAELNSKFVRREVASLLRQFPPKRLAERRTLQPLDANTQLRHDVQFLIDFGEQKAARVEREPARERATLEEDFRRLADDHLEETQALNQRAADLEAELNQARRKIQTLETRISGPTMMYWNKLDDTSWTNFVPNSYFLQAEVLLDAMAIKDTIPSKWPPLEDGANEQFSPSSNENDDCEDQDYDDAAERAASAQIVQGNVLVLDVESDEDEATPPSRRPSAIKRARSASDSSSGEDTTSLSTSSSLPATSAQLQHMPPCKERKSRVVKASSLRTRSPLARVDFERFTTAERRVAERPGAGIRSWRIRGVRAQYSPKKGKHVSQTPGHPYYAPHKQEIWILVERWREHEYRELIATKPWKTMWRNRIKVLYFHRRSELTAAQFKLLDKLMEYIHEHRQAFWEVLHWVIMKAKAIEGDDEDSSDYTGSVEQYQDRTARHESVGRQMGLRVSKLISKGLPPSIFQEPGIWTYPSMVCYWFVKDPSAIQDGEPRTLTEPLEELEQDEPGRNQWWSCTEEQRLAHIPAILKAKLVPALERNLISERFP